MQVLRRSHCLLSIVLTCCTFSRTTVNIALAMRSGLANPGTPDRLGEADVPDVRFMRQKHFDELVVSFSSRLAIVLPTSWAIAREAWMIKIPFRLALNKAASDKLRGIASITMDWKKAFSQCVASLAHGLGLLVSKMEESVAKYRPDLFHFPRPAVIIALVMRSRWASPSVPRPLISKWVQDTQQDL